MPGHTVAVRLPDDESFEMVRTILAYESVMRGRKIGQTFMELVMEAADIDSYPKEVRDRLAEISGAAEKKSIERFLSNL